MKLCHWAFRLEFETDNHHHKFCTMSLHAFSKRFYPGNKYGVTQLIKKHWKNKYMVMFSPNVLLKEDGKNYE